MDNSYFFEQGFFKAEPKGMCIDFSYYNVLGDPANKTTWVYEDHQVTTIMEVSDKPDQFYVIPAPGWEVVTDNYLSVQEWVTAIITVCQVALS